MAVDLDALKAELTNDPLVRGYSGMSDQAAADDLNGVYRTRNRSSMTASEVLNAVDAGEYTVLTAGNKDRLWQLLAIGELNPFGVEATLMIGIFGAGSVTITALQAARQEAVSRAVELELGSGLGTGLVAEARRL